MTSRKGWFNQNFLGYDYVVYEKGSTIRAISSDPAYDDESDTDFVDLIEACFTNRSSVGAKIKFYGSYDIKSTLNFPTTDNKDFYLVGNGMQNSVLTAHADLGANTMMLCNRATWDSPQVHTVVGVKDMFLDPNNIADSCLELPYTMCDLDNLYIDMDLASGGTAAIGRLGGSAGGTYPSHIGTLKFHYVSSAQPYRCIDLWYDTCHVKQIAISQNVGSSATTVESINLNGEFYSFDEIIFFLSENNHLGTVFNANGIYASIGVIATITHGAGSTIDGIIQTDGSSYIAGNMIRAGDANHTLYYDATSQSDCDFQMEVVP